MPGLQAKHVYKIGTRPPRSRGSPYQRVHRRAQATSSYSPTSVYELDMFGGLFDNEGDGDGPVKVPDEACPPPPAPRGRTKLAGIYNQGTTCFLNTLLQALSFLPEFRGALFQLSPEELGFYSQEERRRRVIPIQLQMFMASLMLEEQKAVSTASVTDCFGWGDQVMQQHDVQELYSVLATALNDSLRGTSGQNIVRNLMHVTTVQKIGCEGCGNVTEKEAEESTIFLKVEGFTKGLEQSLRHSFCSEEKMTGDNKYRCDRCDCLQDAQKTLKLRKLPSLLIFALNRFAHNSNYETYKVIDRFPFPMELNMGEYTEDGQYDPELTYELTVVIVHIGGTGGGHYIVSLRDIDNLGYWEMMDEQVEVPPSEIIQSDLVDCVSAKQVVATILSNLLKEVPMVTVDRLSAEIGKKTGVPWAKHYKRRYGSFPKFLKENSDVFFVEQNEVTLIERPQGSSEASNTPRTDDPAEEGCSRNPPPSKPEKRAPQKAENQPRPGHNWFFFNDAGVSPMHAADLKNDFGGRKSAYMLIYRRKTCQRPAEAEGNPAYGIPEHLLSVMAEKNKSLQTERDEYARYEQEKKEQEEKKRNEVQVEIHYHFNCTVERGMLTTDNTSVTESFPKTMTLRELKQIIATLSSGHLEEGNFHVHRMKRWGEKTHLYEEFTDEEKTLQDLAIDKFVTLFAWDGYQVSGVEMPTGVKREPLILELKEYFYNSSCTHAFPKNLTLREFRAQVSKITGIPAEWLRLQFPEITLNGDPGNRGNQTLESIGLTDSACVLYDGTNNESFVVDLGSWEELTAMDCEPEPGTVNSRMCLRIENRCDMDLIVRKLEVDTNMTVGSVKQLFMTMYCIQCDSPVLQQRVPFKGIQPPYDDTLTVSEAGITSETNLLLNRSKMDVTVKLSNLTMLDFDTLKVSVSKTCTVAECLMEVAKKVNFAEDPFNWHLCKSNFMFDHLGVLEDLEQVMDSSFQYILLEKGRLLPKDHISLLIHVCTSPNELKPLRQDAEIHLDELVIEDPQPCGDPILIGELKLHKDETLEKLRLHITGLLNAINYCVPPTQLRLRLIGGRGNNRLRRVLRDPQNTLRRLKLDSNMSVGVEVVNHEVNLSKEEIVLNVSLKNPRDNSYSPAQELLWDTRCGSSGAKLKQDIALRLGLPEEMLVIAKHFPDNFFWMIINDKVPAPVNRNFGGSKRGKKQSPAVKANIRHKPYCVEDGDEIGVIYVLGSPGVGVSADDFCTVEDMEGRRLREEKNQKNHLEHQARGLNGLSFPMPRCPEVALKIHVSDYS